ncbi:putative RNA-directed DNA polymerase [Helianthus annuus]|nr:putative RNA-directed DNA polymerase [Helianthus annuus]
MSLIEPFSSTDKTTHNSHKFGFTLTPTNYGYWKAMIQPFLTTNGLFGYVNGTILCPEPLIQPPAATGKETTAAASTPNPSYTAWISNDAHIRMLLMSTNSEASFQHVQGTTSRDLWLALERAYAPHTASREFTLKTQLMKIQMKGDETYGAYLARAQEYASALANIGSPMSDKDIVMLVVSGLRDEYNPIKQNLVTRQFTAVFSELPSLLADYEYMIKKSAPEVGPAQAFTTSSSQNPSLPSDTMQALQQLVSKLGLQLQPATTMPSSSSNAVGPAAFYTNRGRGRGNNYNRGRGRGSYQNRSQGSGGFRPNPGQFSWASNQNTVYGTCNRCGIGHLPSQCPNRDPSTFRSRQPSAYYADTRSQASSQWLPDTGSSNHVAPDMTNFDSAEPYYGEDNLHVGNGHVYTHYPPHGSK